MTGSAAVLAGAALALEARVKIMTTRTSLLTSLALLAVLADAVPAWAQAGTRKLFEAGQYQPVIDAAGPEAEPSVVYLAAFGHQKMGGIAQAVATARRLAALPEDSPWHFIGQSLAELLE